MDKAGAPEEHDKVHFVLSNPNSMRFFHNNGVLPVLNEALQALYEQDPRPEDPISFIHQKLVLACNNSSDPMAELMIAKEKLEKLKTEHAELLAKQESCPKQEEKKD